MGRTVFMLTIIVFGIILPSVHVRGRAMGKTRHRAEDCLDVAIIGGGVGGTYSAWKLRNRGMKIELFERSDRIGGRLWSVFLPSMPSVGIELGGMRYTPGQHPILQSVIDELGLTSVPFHPSGEDTMYYLRGVHMTREELLTDKLPYRLNPEEPRDPEQLRWKVLQQALNLSNTDVTDYTELVTVDGKPIYEQGYLSLLGNKCSNEAKEYLRVYKPFLSYSDNVNMACGLPIPLRKPGTGEGGFPERSIVQGYDTIPKTMAKQFLSASKDHNVRMNHRVDKIKKRKIGKNRFYILTVSNTQKGGDNGNLTSERREVCVERVIFAGPRRALEKIKWKPLQKDPAVIAAMNSVFETHVLKIYMIYPSAWWDKLDINYKSFLSDLPLRQTMEYARYRTDDGEERAVLLHYADGETLVDYWNELRKSEGTISSDAVPAIHAVSDKVSAHVHHHLAELFNVDVNTIPAPIDGAMSVWSDGISPYGGGWYIYRPGYNWNDVKRLMRRPSKKDRVYVVSNSYSEEKYAGFVEGSLRVAEDVLNEFFL